jgi:proline iminopeptidase
MERHNSEGFWEESGEGMRFYPACPYPQTEKRLVEANGIRFWTELEGKGPPLIAVHGGPGGNHCCFHPGLSTLAGAHTVVYYELRGHYMSSAPQDATAYGLMHDVADLEALRIALGFGEIDLFGYSYGSMVALKYAQAHPGHLRRIVFCSAPVGVTDEDYEAAAKDDPIATALDAATSPDEQEELYFRLYYHKPLGRVARRYAKLARDAFGSTKSRHVLAAYNNDTADVNWDDELPRIAAPILFLVGTHDICGRLSLNAIRTLLPGLPQARLEVFEHSAHDPFTDEPERFGTVVGEFLV